MKTSLTTACLVGGLIVGTLWGQDATTPAAATGRASSPGASTAAGRGGLRAGASGTAATLNNNPPLNENVSIHVKGNLAPGVPANFTLTGCGPDFALTQPFSEVEIDGHKYQNLGICKISIVSADDGYRLEYNLLCEVPEFVDPSANPAPPRAGMPTSPVRYRAVVTKSSVALKLGQNITVPDSNGQDLNFSLSAAP